MSGDVDILSRLAELDEQRNGILNDARAERVRLVERLEKLNEILGSVPEPVPATKPRTARGKVTAAVRDALAAGVECGPGWAQTFGYNAASVARAVRKAKAAA